MLRFLLHTKFIVLLTSVSLVPLIVVAGVTLARYQQTLEDDASKLGHQLASTAAAEIRSFMVSQFGILENIAAIYHPDFPIEPNIAEDITEITLLRSENFMDISVVDAAGDEIARKNRLLVVTENDLGNVSATEAFASVRERGVYVGPVYVRSGRRYFRNRRSARTCLHRERARYCHRASRPLVCPCRARSLCLAAGARDRGESREPRHGGFWHIREQEWGSGARFLAPDDDSSFRSSVFRDAEHQLVCHRGATRGERLRRGAPCGVFLARCFAHRGSARHRSRCLFRRTHLAPYRGASPRCT